MMFRRVVYVIVAFAVVVVLQVQRRWHQTQKCGQHRSTPHLNASQVKVDLDIPFDHASFGPKLPAR